MFQKKCLHVSLVTFSDRSNVHIIYYCSGISWAVIATFINGTITSSLQERSMIVTPNH